MRSIKKALRGVKVHCHEVAPFKKQRKNQNDTYKSFVNIGCYSRLLAVSCWRTKTLIVAKNRRTILPQRNILKSHNMRRTFYRSKKTKKSLKNITATGTIILNNGNI